jgi:hypothetical protein
MPPSARLAAIRILKFTGCNCASLICQTPMMICIRCPLPLGYRLPCFCVFAQSIRRCLFALGVVVLHFVEFSRPDRLPGVSTNAILQTSRPHTSLCWSLMFFLKCSESGPLLGPSCLPSFAVAEPTDNVSKLRSTYFQVFKTGELIVLVPRWLPPAGVCVGWPPPDEKRSSMFWTPCVLYGLGNQYWRMKR